MGIRICPMLFQIPFPAFHLQLYTFPNPRLNNGFIVILNIKLLNLPFIHNTFLCQKICDVAFLQKGILFIFFICLCQVLHKKIYLFLQLQNSYIIFPRNPRNKFFKSFCLQSCIPVHRLFQPHSLQTSI